MACVRHCHLPPNIVNVLGSRQIGMGIGSNIREKLVVCNKGQYHLKSSSTRLLLAVKHITCTWSAGIELNYVCVVL